MNRRPGRTLWPLGLLGTGAVVAAAVLAWPHGRPGPEPAREQTFPLPPLSESPFRNTGPDARYIGTAACAECHRRNYASYLLTAHSRALADPDPKAEPPDGSFDHPASGCSYRVYRKGDRLHHEEVLRTAAGREIGRVDLPVRYVIGSGHFTRSYLVEVDGFLLESPITWYTARDRWDMSPGYDDARRWSFSRQVTAGCLACHAGRVETTAGPGHHLTLAEKAIGCENCHGPGSLHQEHHRAGPRPAGEDDPTIVHPGKLSRPLLEAICAACHLSGPATVPLRGRRAADFRPGMPTDDYVIHYRLENGREPMTVVGHVEQLRLSACYRHSDLTCVTCHDPHRRAEPKDKVAFYRQKCLGCHTAQSCGLTVARRLEKSATDDCVACHMPRGNTEIPHIAFTHHRIGLHPRKPAAAPAGRTPDLVPVEDVSRLSPVDWQRNLGLAYLEVSQKPSYAAYRDVFRARARAHLAGTRAAGLREAATAEALAEVYAETDRARAGACAREALAAADASADVRAGALRILATVELHDRNFRAAAGLLEELVGLRRDPDAWRRLADCDLVLGQPEKALQALRQALAIQPYDSATHAALAQVYRQLGDSRRADGHLEKARWLAGHGPE